MRSKCDLDTTIKQCNDCGSEGYANEIIYDKRAGESYCFGCRRKNVMASMINKRIGSLA